MSQFMRPASECLRDVLAMPVHRTVLNTNGVGKDLKASSTVG